MNSKSTPRLMLFSRTVLFLVIQALFALGFFLAGSPKAWNESANWWPLAVALADLACLALLIHVFKAEGKRFWDLFRIERGHIKGDFLTLLGMTLLAAPLSYLPNVLLGQTLFGSPEATLALVVRPLPLWAVYAAIVLFPVGQGLTELAMYFGYIMPRIEAQGINKWLAIFIPALMLGLQHIAAPFLFDVRYIIWRGLMFIPFALMTGVFFHWRPRLLPYFAVIHALMDMSFAVMFMSVAY